MRDKNTKYNNKSIKKFINYIMLPIIILLIGQLCDVFRLLKPYSMPTIKAVLQTAWNGIVNLSIVSNIIVSFLRVLTGFLIAASLALILGVAIAISEIFEVFTDLVLKIFKPIPPIAWIPLAILWFVIGEGSKIFIIGIGVFFQ